MTEMSPIDWAKRPLQKYAVFSGRAPRAEYWWFYLAYLVAYIVASITDGLVGFPVFSLLVTFGLLIPMLAVSVRRLHDTDRSGWWLLAPAVPYVLAFVLGGAALLNPTEAGAGSLGLATVFLLAGAVMVIVLLVFMILAGTPGSNRYGPNPYGSGALDEVAV